MYYFKHNKGVLDEIQDITSANRFGDLLWM